MTNYTKRFENFAEFLADTEAMPIDTVLTELQNCDVDVAKVVSEVRTIAGPSHDRATFGFAGNLAKRSKKELLKLLEELESGPFGGYASSPLAAAARSRDLSMLSESELRERIGHLQDNKSGDDRDDHESKT